MKDNIILIGFMGVGKSEVGKALAARLQMKYVDTDLMIEGEESTSIPDIFEKRGEPYFRDLETKLLDKFAASKNHVISTGGGMVLREGNVKKLKALGPLVLLSSRPEVIEKRLENSGGRPLLNVPDRPKQIKDILNVRDPIYNKVADFAVDTSDISVKDAVEKIIDYYEGVKK